MTMTPESVRNKQFETVKLREGYNMGEVDLFLDQVENELERLNNENASLRARIETLQSDQPDPATADQAPVKAAEQPTPAVKASAPLPPVAQPTVQSVSQASTAAVRILEKAAISADELVNEAREQADKLTSDARAEAEQLQTAAKVNAERAETEARNNAERLTNEAHGKASRLEADSRTRADALNREVGARRVELFGKLEAERDKLARDVEELRTFERDYRGRLKGYFSDQLKALDTTPSHADEIEAGNHSHSDGDDTPHLRALRDESS
jgi:DivIVA domain-containing protein